ncbi:MAG: YicC/YloC family endoribonuclease [Desulfovibrionaceae bacterium]|nr:YicC/YloC family endoribonuclease [Desulfovibrionaceae bacterium]
MLRSMTGFGRCLVENSGLTQQWEVKSVNSRHLDLKWRLPPAVRGLEPRLEKTVRRFASRGRVEISLMLQYAAGAAPSPHFDAAQASAMLDCLAGLALARGESFTPDYNALLQVHGLWGDSGEEQDESLCLQLDEGLSLALEDWNEARNAEGRALATDMNSRILRMEEWTGLIQERAPAIKDERARQLRERLGEALAQYGQELEESRLLQELVILADRLDVSEELTRLSTHLERLRQLLQSGGDVGRRLDFTLQECFREVNTCGNKLPDVQLSRLMVDFKNELEKCREQVQNLE